HITGDTWEEFVADCRRKNITYVTWDSRIGLNPNNAYYKMWGIDRLTKLANPNDNGPFEFVDVVQNTYAPNQRYIFIFRLN
ncbi:MAG: hypothetical protein GY869_03900, partial [Planctomycetes bacterium]|nr:hypothetical protein [Planctomycetota bacterium]